MVLVIRTLILYAVVVISMRIMGKRQFGELQPSELDVAIMISDLASVPMQAVEIPLLSGIVPVLTLLVAEVLLSYISLKSEGVRRFLTGSPSLVIYDGHINEKELSRLRFNISDLLEELRLNNYYDISEVEAAVLETGGKLSVIPKDRSRGVTVGDISDGKIKKGGLPYNLISDGKLNNDELRRSGKDADWLKKELAKKNINDVKKVFFASLNNEGELFTQIKGEEDKG